MTLLETVAATLRDAGIPCAMIGGGALAVHGVVRSTFDLDLLATDARALAEETWTAIAASGVTTDLRRAPEDDPLAGVVRFTRGEGRPVDLVVGRDPWQARAIARASHVEVGDGSLLVVGIADLVLLKLYAGGLQDSWDVQQLLDLYPGTGWMEDVDREVAALPPPCAAAWRKLREETA